MSTPTDLNPLALTIERISKDAVAQVALRKTPGVLMHSGVSYADLKGAGEWEVIKSDERLPHTLSTTTLRSVVDFLSGVDDSDTLDIIINSPTSVSIIGPLNSDMVRPVYLHAEVLDCASPILTRNCHQEELVIGLQTRFRAGGDRAALLLHVGTLSGDNVVTQSDDGVSQQTTASSGTRLGTVTLKNPVLLNPMRSFPEVDLGDTLFVVRASKSATPGAAPYIALHEADGGLWRSVAAEKIFEILSSNLAAAGVKVGSILR